MNLAETQQRMEIAVQSMKLGCELLDRAASAPVPETTELLLAYARAALALADAAMSQVRKAISAEA